jgi:hypothetical protein
LGRQGNKISGKNQAPIVLGINAPTFGFLPSYPGLSWQATSPVTGFYPQNMTVQGQGSIPSGNPSGSMASTNTIYTQIVDVSRMDNIGLEINWTGTPVGTISIEVSNSGINFYPLSDFSSSISQPSGSASGFVLALLQLPYKYFFIQYVNSSGSGTLKAYCQVKDLN